MKVNIKKLKKLMTDILVQRGIAKADAAIIVDEHIEGELQGKESHGLMAFPSLVKKLPLKKSVAINIKKTGSYLFVDAKNSFGAVVGRRSADPRACDQEARRRYARQNGLDR